MFSARSLVAWRTQGRGRGTFEGSGPGRPPRHLKGDMIRHKHLPDSVESS
jgi:hypothetical protein